MMKTYQLTRGSHEHAAYFVSAAFAHWKQQRSTSWACPGPPRYCRCRGRVRIDDGHTDQSHFRALQDRGFAVHGSCLHRASQEESSNEMARNDESEEFMASSISAVTPKDISDQWLSYALGVALGRFQPGVVGAVGRGRFPAEIATKLRPVEGYKYGPLGRSSDSKPPSRAGWD
jgi:hypothetical protein